MFGLFLVACQPELAQPLPTVAITAVSPLPTHQSTATPLPFPTATIDEPVETAVSPSPTVVKTAVSHLPHFENPINPALSQLAEATDVELVVITAVNSGFWDFPPTLISHPINMQKNGRLLYILDSGRIIQLNLDEPNEQLIILSEETIVDDVPVIEPLDMAWTTNGLLVLDRAGDVYRFDAESKSWVLDRYGRKLEDTSGHYYTAFAASNNDRVLLESSYHFVQRYGDRPRIWPLDEQIGVDVAIAEMTYVLQQSPTTDEGALTRYSNARLDSRFVPALTLAQVRQLAVTETAVYILDHAGQRLVQLDKEGEVVRLYQTPPTTQSFWVGQDEHLLFIGSAGLFWVDQPQNNQILEQHTTSSIAPFSPALISDLTFTLPITGTNLTERPLQMPGAPRHYRLGVHEGLDFYWRRGTPVQVVADGEVIFAQVTYEKPPLSQYVYWYDLAHEIGKTPDEAINFYRGMQLWVEHPNGFISRYVHLSEIAPNIQVGTQLTQGQTIGNVGNSGSPSSRFSTVEDAHLHFELWHHDTYLGQYLRPIETWEQIKQLWP